RETRLCQPGLEVVDLRLRDVDLERGHGNAPFANAGDVPPARGSSVPTLLPAGVSSVSAHRYRRASAAAFSASAANTRQLRMVIAAPSRFSILSREEMPAG